MTTKKIEIKMYYCYECEKIWSPRPNLLTKKKFKYGNIKNYRPSYCPRCKINNYCLTPFTAQVINN